MTPAHWFTSVSNASGSAIARPVTSRICWPLSVTSGWPSFMRKVAVPPLAAKWRAICAAAMGITSTGSGNTPSVCTRLDASAMQTKRSASDATIFSRVSAAPPPLTI
ncbi:hypothetical protein D3C72_2147700 [compost metagenome]